MKVRGAAGKRAQGMRTTARRMAANRVIGVASPPRRFQSQLTISATPQAVSAIGAVDVFESTAAAASTAETTYTDRRGAWLCSARAATDQRMSTLVRKSGRTSSSQK